MQRREDALVEESRKASPLRVQGENARLGASLRLPGHSHALFPTTSEWVFRK